MLTLSYCACVCVCVGGWVVGVCVCVVFVFLCFSFLLCFVFKDEKCPLKKKQNKTLITQSVNWCERSDALLKYHSVPKTSKEGWTYYRAYGREKKPFGCLFEYSCWTNFSATRHHNLTKSIALSIVLTRSVDNNT